MTEGLVELVRSKTNITNVIGTDPMRFYPVMLPQGESTFPAVVFRSMPIQDNKSFDGASTYDFHYFDIFFYGRTFTSAEDIFETFRTEIEDVEGTFGGVVIDHVWFQPSGIEDYIDDLKLYTKQGEYKIAVRR